MRASSLNRSRVPHLAEATVRAGAVQAGVCVRPIVRQLVDTQTGDVRLVPIPCQSTLASQCPPCADKARRLRMQQCREGWHLEHEPEPPHRTSPLWWLAHPEVFGAVALVATVAAALRANTERRKRSTRRRDDVPELPRLKVEDRTLGRTFTGRDGKTWRPSMFVTFTMGSYGPVHSDGTPLDPARYDYRRAALDALHLSKLWDRLTQNLRRAVGWEVQYFAAIEPQKRLAPHIHAAIRGAIPREILRQVIAATYASVWWPRHDRIVYRGDHIPVWDSDTGGYVDPHTHQPLATWDQALDDLDADETAEPAHVVRFGRQSDMQGLVGGTDKADRRVGYLTKYLTKAIVDPLDDQENGAVSPAREAHIDRLHAQVRWLPCSPRCWNWLAYGIQPKDAADGAAPGACPSKAHDREHLGCGGRRVLVSRKWTGKTLSGHKADRLHAVRAVLEAAGIDAPDVDRCSATTLDETGRPRYIWQAIDIEDLPTYTEVIAQTVTERQRWRTQYEAAKERASPNPHSDSATDDAA
ncbi:replication initiator [Actinopolymorpha pittospori]|uniref:Replication initiation protein n=3 Tax=Actinopolymorpha pittospori TaxID=648752 RepID=A0A927N9V0_9ACTN|nr:replication initiator [Actinopolymorpha pittospori]MBE1610975.1 hypothetical protein [Actinopolymorpha pittospori]